MPAEEEEIEFGRIAAAVFGVPLVTLQFITYIMCVIRWFSHDFSFWGGLKELIWIAIPVINFTYVWDWWLNFIGFTIGMIQTL